MRYFIVLGIIAAVIGWQAGIAIAFVGMVAAGARGEC